MRLLPLLLALCATPVLAQYKGPAVDACLVYAKREVARYLRRAGQNAARG